MSETDLHQRIRNELEQQFPRSAWLKFHGGPFTQVGVGDVIGCLAIETPDKQYLALYCEFEVKLPGEENTLSEVQEKRIEDLTSLYAITGVITCSQDAIKLISDKIKELWKPTKS